MDGSEEARLRAENDGLRRLAGELYYDLCMSDCYEVEEFYKDRLEELGVNLSSVDTDDWYEAHGLDREEWFQYAFLGRTNSFHQWGALRIGWHGEKEASALAGRP